MKKEERIKRKPGTSENKNVGQSMSILGFKKGTTAAPPLSVLKE